jgi:hypothetical protein
MESYLSPRVKTMLSKARGSDGEQAEAFVKRRGRLVVLGSILQNFISAEKISDIFSASNFDQSFA